MFNKFSHFRQNLQQQLGVRVTGTYRAELWRGPEDGEEDTFVKAFMIALFFTSSPTRIWGRREA